MKTTVLVLIIALLLSLIGNYFQYRGARQQEISLLDANETLGGQVELLLAELHESDSIVIAIREQRQKDSVKFSVAEKHLKSSVATLKKTIATLRPQIVPQIDSLPLVKEFIALQDSTIEKQDSLNVVLSGQIYDQGKSFTAEIEQLNAQILASNQISDLWQESAESSMKLYQKLKKKRFSVGPEISYGVNKDGLSPSVGFSVQYSLFRF